MNFWGRGGIQGRSGASRAGIAKAPAPLPFQTEPEMIGIRSGESSPGGVAGHEIGGRFS